MNWMKLMQVSSEDYESINRLMRLEEAGQVYYGGDETEVIILPFEKLVEELNIPVTDETFKEIYVDETGNVFLVYCSDTVYVVAAKDVIQWIVSNAARYGAD